MEENIIDSFHGPMDAEGISLFNSALVSFIVIFTIWYVRYHWNRRRLYQMAAQRKGPSIWPIVGNGLSFIGSNEEKLKNACSMMSTYESAFPLWLGQKLYVVITDPKHLQKIMNSPYGLEKDESYKYGKPIVGSGLFTSSVNQWKKHRKIITPTFNQKILDSFVEIFSKQAEILVTQLERVTGTGYFDAFNYFSSFTLDTICETAMGITINAQTTNSDFAYCANKAMEIAFERMLKLWYQYDFIFNLTAMSEEFKICCEKLAKFIGSVVKQKRTAYLQKLKEDSENPECNYEETSRNKITFLQQLLEISEGGANLTDEELRDEVISVMIAGSETTASVNSYVMIMMGLHHDIQEKVYEEIVNVLGYDRPVECNDLPKLQYLEMVIKETMRLFPLGPFLGRSITGDINLGDYNLSVGSSVILGIIQVHRDPKIWPDPLKFDPLRFIPRECEKRHPYSFLPFSGGPRNCVGLKYAMMAMKTALATILRRYKVTTNYKSIQEIRLKADVVLKPVDGFTIALKFRDPCKRIF